MKKIGCWVLVIFMVIFLAYPSFSEARGGPGGPPSRGHNSPPPRGGSGDWWIPLAVVGGVVAIATAFAIASDNKPKTVAITEQNPVVQPAVYVATSSAEKIYVYPRQGQSEDQQARDSYECHSWAVNQTHFDPSQSNGGMSENKLNQMRTNYQRAMAACFDGRGYTMR